MLDSFTLMRQTKESNKRAPGRVVIYISVHLVLIYTLTFSNVLLVLALNVIVHKSSYCKCSLAWCQARTFLLVTIWTHPLQMREYPLQYASTDKNKKSHYITAYDSIDDILVLLSTADIGIDDTLIRWHTNIAIYCWYRYWWHTNIAIYCWWKYWWHTNNVTNTFKGDVDDALVLLFILMMDVLVWFDLVLKNTEIT